MRNILIGTNNKGKVREIKALLHGMDVTLFTLADLGINFEVEEDGNTYAENASKKAITYARASGMPALGDDSGLEVDALDGMPGLHSHRFNPLPNASDADRRKYLLERLAGKPRPWNACFHATIAVADASGSVELANGTCEGIIIPEERGNNGFGYDPIFFIPVFNRTMAELSMTEKNQVSHRAMAIKNAIPLIKQVLEE
jgi:XTP/dITP diphosphohydrolase